MADPGLHTLIEFSLEQDLNSVILNYRYDLGSTNVAIPNNLLIRKLYIRETSETAHLSDIRFSPDIGLYCYTFMIHAVLL